MHIIGKSNSHHFIHFTVLIVGLLLTVFFFDYFSYSFVISSFVLFLGSLFYFVWGIVHHAIEDRVTAKIVLEYFSFSVFVFVLVMMTMAL